jgi:hypothetical protein
VTQTVSSAAAQQAFDRLARDLGVARSNVLQAILESIDTGDLVALVSGRVGLRAAKTITLDAEALLAIRSAVSSSLSLFGDRVTEGARMGAQIAISDWVKGSVTKDELSN